jgi:U3 small nucleolar RNA-associated protein 25
MLSPYETPEFRSLFNSHLNNVAGKKRAESIYKPIQVPEGIEQVRENLS